MSLWTKVRGTVEALFQLGLGGAQLKGNSAAIEHRNATDSAFVVARGADPVGANDFVTKQFLGSGNTVQAIFVELSVDTTTTSNGFVTLLSQTITIAAGSALVVLFTGGCETTNGTANVSFRLQIDGVTKRGVGISPSGANSPQSFALVYLVTSLSAGAHTVTVQWLTTSGTAKILPVSIPNYEHFSLLVQETKL